MFLPPMQISRSPSVSGAMRPPSTRPASKISALWPAAASASAAAMPPTPPPTTAIRRLCRSSALMRSHVRDAHRALAAVLPALGAAHLAAAAVLVQRERAHHVALELAELLEAHVEARDQDLGVVHPELLARAGHRHLLDGLEQEQARHVVEPV